MVSPEVLRRLNIGASPGFGVGVGLGVGLGLGLGSGFGSITGSGVQKQQVINKIRMKRPCFNFILLVG